MTDADTDDQTQSGSPLIGFSVSCLLAFVIGVLGGAFEALILWPLFGFVTVTLAPDLVFVIANSLFLTREESRRTRIGIGFGFLAVIITAVVSFVVFFAMAPNFPDV